MIWVSHMKTTIDIDDALFAELKQRSAAEGKSMRSFLEEALWARLRPRPRSTRKFRLDLPVIRGTRPPAVDINDRRVLYDFMSSASNDIGDDEA